MLCVLICLQPCSPPPNASRRCRCFAGTVSCRQCPLPPGQPCSGHLSGSEPLLWGVWLGTDRAEPHLTCGYHLIVAVNLGEVLWPRQVSSSVKWANTTSCMGLLQRLGCFPNYPRLFSLSVHGSFVCLFVFNSHLRICFFDSAHSQFS